MFGKRFKQHAGDFAVGHFLDAADRVASQGDAWKGMERRARKLPAAS